jgi:hypothetical protein
VEDDWLTFYIKPADGLELPTIMKWLKQVFAQRYNRAEGRIGHIWGDRYGSRILEGEAPVEEESGAGRGDSDSGVRPRYRETAIQTVFPSIIPVSPRPWTRINGVNPPWVPYHPSFFPQAENTQGEGLSRKQVKPELWGQV